MKRRILEISAVLSIGAACCSIGLAVQAQHYAAQEFTYEFVVPATTASTELEFPEGYHMVFAAGDCTTAGDESFPTPAIAVEVHDVTAVSGQWIPNRHPNCGCPCRIGGFGVGERGVLGVTWSAERELPIRVEADRTMMGYARYFRWFFAALALFFGLFALGLVRARRRVLTPRAAA